MCVSNETEIKSYGSMLPDNIDLISKHIQGLFRKLECLRCVMYIYVSSFVHVVYSTAAYFYPNKDIVC